MLLALTELTLKVQDGPFTRMIAVGAMFVLVAVAVSIVAKVAK
jgi:hypothetical protein